MAELAIPISGSKMEDDDERVTLDEALDNIMPGHGFSDSEILRLRRKWNTEARTWAENEGTKPGHGQKALVGRVWKNTLPWTLDQGFLEPILEDAARARREQNRLKLQQLQEMIDFDNAFLGGQ